MKERLIYLLLLFWPGILAAQDTIFIRSGEIIPAVIVSKDNSEIKYKKFNQPSSAAVYSVFVTDVKSIHYSDGIIADYTAAPGSTNKAKQRAVDNAGKLGTGRLSFGASMAYWKWNVPQDITDFWQKNPLFANNTPVEFNPVYYPVEFRMSFPMGQLRRNWLGTGLELILTPPDAISAKSSDGLDAISLKSFYYNIPMYWGRSINHKKNVIAIFEPALNLSFVSGTVKNNNTEYKIVTNLGTGMSIATGLDWIVSKRFIASVRVGQRFLKQKESHKKNDGSNDYSSFYVNPAVSEETLTIKWNGPFVSAGLCWSGHFWMKGFGSKAN